MTHRVVDGRPNRWLGRRVSKYTNDVESNPGELIRRERLALGISTRELAALSGVSYPTISRIENGHDQPRWDTLERLAGALGMSWRPVLEQRPAPRLADLAGHWTPDRAGNAEPPWTRLRALADQLRARPELTAVAIAAEPGPSGSELVDNLLAATAEKLADDAGLRRPPWTRRVEPLSTPWAAAATPRKRAEHVARTPPQFAARNITLPASAIWRERAQATP